MASDTIFDGTASEGLAFESPVTRSYPPAPEAQLTLVDESAAAKLVVRADDDTEVTTRLAVRFGAARSEADVLILGQRPGEWLLVGHRSPTEAFAATLDRTGHVSLVDHTHSRALFRLSGQDARPTLEKICGLDLSDDMTPDGAVMSAPVAKVTCDMARNDNPAGPSYLMLCDRSFGQYLFDAVLDAGIEFGIGVAPPG